MQTARRFGDFNHNERFESLIKQRGVPTMQGAAMEAKFSKHVDCRSADQTTPSTITIALDQATDMGTKRNEESYTMSGMRPRFQALPSRPGQSVVGDSYFSKAPSRKTDQWTAKQPVLDGNPYYSRTLPHMTVPSNHKASGNDMSWASFRSADEPAIKGQFDDAEDNEMDQIMISIAVLISNASARAAAPS